MLALASGQAAATRALGLEGSTSCSTELPVEFKQGACPQPKGWLFWFPDSLVQESSSSLVHGVSRIPRYRSQNTLYSKIPFLGIQNTVSLSTMEREHTHARTNVSWLMEYLGIQYTLFHDLPALKGVGKLGLERLAPAGLL